MPGEALHFCSERERAAFLLESSGKASQRQWDSSYTWSNGQVWEREEGGTGDRREGLDERVHAFILSFVDGNVS